MSGTFPNQPNTVYTSTYGEVRNYSQGPTYTAYNAASPYQNVAYPTTTYSTQTAALPNNPQTQPYQICSDATVANGPTYGETLAAAGYKPVTGEALDLPAQNSSLPKRGGFNSRSPFANIRQKR